MDLLQAACAHLGITVDQVLSHGTYEDHVAVVVDRGIKGCPKYLVALADLGHSASLDIAEEAPAMAPVEPASIIAERALDSFRDVPVVEVASDATEAARRLAEEAGVELTWVEGTGSGGRITKRDVQRAVAAREE